MKTHDQLASGFTLAEMLIVLVIVGILASIAMPGLRMLIQGQQAKAASYELFSALALARSEAIKRNGNVTVTPNASGWQAGWTITTSSGTTVKSHESVKGAVITGGPGSVVYTRSGRISGAAAASFQVDIGSTTSVNVRCIKIELSGMPRTVKGVCT